MIAIVKVNSRFRVYIKGLKLNFINNFKGAPEYLLERCHFYYDENGKI